MFTLLCNVKITRRQEMVFVIDDQDVLQWSGRDVYNAVEWIKGEGQSHFHLDGGDHQEKLHLTIAMV